MQNLLDNISVRPVAGAEAAGTGTTTSDAIDMEGFEGVLILCDIGTANAGNYLKAQQSSDDAAADAYADLEGTKVVATNDGEICALDVYRPGERYVKGLLVRGASSTHGRMIAIRYGARKAPVDNTVDDNVRGETHVSPAEGTA